MTTTDDHDQDGTAIEQPTIMRNIVKEPQNNTGGFGIAHVENSPPHETEFRVEQLWANGDVHPVFIGDEDDALALAQELIEVVRRER